MNVRITRMAPVLPVDDVPAAIDWYQSALGFSPEYVNQDGQENSAASVNYAILTSGQLEIHLAKKDEQDKTLCSPGNCYLFVFEIKKLHVHLSSMKAQVGPLEQMPWGHLECWLHDPCENRLVLSEPG